MSNLYNRIEHLCNDKGINITQMCKDAGVSRASLTDLKMDRKQGLSSSTLSRISNYFGVSVDYLLGAGKERTAAPKSDGLSPEDARIMDLLRRLSPENKRKFAEILEALAEPPTQAPDDQA